MTTHDKQLECGWNKDGTLRSCIAMRDHADEAPSHKKGLSYVVVTNAETLESTMYGVVYKKTATHPGIMLNYCPWCGGEIAPRRQ